MPRSARDIVGPTGWVWSKAWDELEKHQSTYMRSFDPKVPRSIFVSEREGTTHNIPIPVAERMLETHRRQEESEPDRPVSDSL